MTLIEILIYIALISFLMAGFIRFAYDTGIYSLKLLNDIEDAYNA